MTHPLNTFPERVVNKDRNHGNDAYWIQKWEAW